MENQLAFFVNGVKVTETHPDPRANLLHFLRRRLRLTGSKESCGEGRCGSCTVMISRYDRREKLVRHISANACLVPLCSLHNMAVTTVEGVGDSRRGLHTIQEELAAAHGIQCGFCTPGMVMSMYTLLRSNLNPSQDDIITAIEGNLCRCTGYRSIIDGFTNAAKSCCMGNGCSKCCLSQEDDATPSLHEEQDRSLTFEHDGVIWIRPRDLSHLLLLLAEDLQAKVICGGTTIMLDMKLRNKLPQTLVSTNHIPELTMLEVKDDHLFIGAGLTLEELRLKLPAVINKLPAWKGRSLVALSKALSWLAACQIRNVASLAGNLLNPATVSDLQPLFLSMDAVLHLDSAVIGPRTIPYRELMRSTPPLSALQTADVLVYVTLPFTQKDDYVNFYKHSERSAFNTSHFNAVPYLSLEPGKQVIKEFHVTFGGKCVKKVSKIELSKFAGKNWSLGLVGDVLSTVENCDVFRDVLKEDGHHLAKVDVFRFMYFVEEALTQKTSSSSPAPSEPAKMYESTRVFDDVKPSQPSHDPLRRPIPQFSSLYMTSGEAMYLDDVGSIEDELFAGLVMSTRPHAKILKVDVSKALAMSGVKGYVDHTDVPGKNIWGCTIQGERVFADDKVNCYGQIIGIIVAKDRQVALMAAKQVVVEYEELPAILRIEDAMAAGSFYPEEAAKPVLAVGDVEKGFQESAEVVEGTFDIDAREQHYMETHAVVVTPKPEHSQVDVYCTSQNPTQTQKCVARVLGLSANRVTCHVKRLGGGFGGKETRSNMLTQPVAVAAYKFRRSVRCVLERRTDMTISGKGASVSFKYKLGSSKTGEIKALVLDVYVDGGYAADIAYAYLQQAVLNFEASYRFPNCRVSGYLCKTNIPPNTATRGFGFQDVLVVVEDMLNRMAAKLNISTTQIREVNMFKEGEVTLTTYRLEHCMLSRCWEQTLLEGRYEMRRQEVLEFNRNNRWRKRAISVIPLRFGIGYRERYFCQGGALVQVYTDGTVLVAQGGTEMGQGLYIKMIQIASHVLNIPSADIHIEETSTSTVPNTSSTAASVSSDLNGQAVKAACEEIVTRLKPLIEKHPEKTWKQIVIQAYRENINLSAVGHYSSRDCDGFEFDTQKGKPSDYMTYGAGCSLVEVDCLTGEVQVLQSDMVIDVGRSLNPAVDLGQIEGAFQMGLGQMLTERAVVSGDGVMMKEGPADYHISTVRDIPHRLSVSLLKDSSNPHGIFSSKGIGEPSICLAVTVYLAIREAVTVCRSENGVQEPYNLRVPATRQRVREACRACIDNATAKNT